MRKILEILTPENVYVEYELAGLGSRFAAFFIDTLIQCITLVTIGFIALSGQLSLLKTGGKNSLMIALSIVIAFLILFGYFVFFEMILQGQTPGKKLLKLTVVKKNGEPIGFFESMVRNILRIIDGIIIIPPSYVVGPLFIMFGAEYRRVGDFAANTIVVKTKKNEKLVTIDQLLNKANTEQQETEGVNVYPVSNYEYSVLKEFLERKDQLGERRPVFAFHLNKYFLKKFNIEKPYDDPYEFFKEIIRLNSGI